MDPGGCRSRCAMLAACLGMAAALASAQESVPVNLLKNGGFETLDKGAPEGWTLATDGGLVSFTVGQEEPREGERYLRMEGEAKTATARSERVAIDPARGYTLTAQVRVKSGNAIILLTFFNGDAALGTEASQVIGPAPGWKQLTCRPERGKYPTATHLVATIVGSMKIDLCYDDLVLTAR